MDFGSLDDEVKWRVTTSCAGPGDTSAAKIDTIEVAGVSPADEFELVVSQPTPLDTTGCASGDLMLVEVSRDTLDAHAGQAAVYGAEFTIGRN